MEDESLTNAAIKEYFERRKDFILSKKWKRKSWAHILQKS